MAAIRTKAEELAGKPAMISGFSRHSRAIFVATAEWTSSEPLPQECAVDLVAKLGGGNQVNVLVREPRCSPLGV